MRRLPSPSSHHRAAICPASEAYPRYQSTHAGASAGAALHQFLSDVPELGRDQAIDRAPEEHRESFGALDLDQLPASDPERFRPEVPIAFDIDTGAARLLVVDGARDYSSATEREVCGTMDVLGDLPEDDAVWVGDYKRGWAPAAPAKRNWQLKAYALMAARLMGRRSAKVAIIRVSEDGSSWFDRATFSAEELDEHQRVLARVMEAVDDARTELAMGGRPETHEGDHCQYCPAMAFCPSKMALAHAVVRSPLEWEASLSTGLTVENAADIWFRLSSAETVVQRLKQVVKDYAAQHGPIPLEDGVVLGEVVTAKEEVIGDVVHQVLSERYGVEVADVAAPPERHATKKSVEAAMRRVLPTIPGGKITRLKEAALEEIRAADGVRVKTSRTVREHRPKALPEDLTSPRSEQPRVDDLEQRPF